MKRIPLLLILSIISVTSCGPVRDYTQPENPQGTAKIDLKRDDQRYYSTEPVLAWWEEFHDPQLSALVKRSLEENLDVRIALANLFEARAISRESGFDRIPTVTTKASYARQRLSEEGISGKPADRTVNNYQAGFDAVWELDLLGRVSERVASHKALEEASLADFQRIYITVAADVAAAYMELRGTQYRLNVAERNAKNQEETYKFTKILQQGGRANELDVLRAYTQFELTHSNIPSLQAQVTAIINRISVLSGQIPDTLRYELSGVKPLPSLPVSVAVGNVEDLLRRRPDIRIAERQLASRVAQYNVSVTEIFPTVDLIGSLGFLATNFSNFGASSVAGLIGPTINWRIFDLGRVRAAIDQADARTQAALAQYEKTVLYALEETQTALSNFSREEMRRSMLQNAARSSFKSTQLAKQRLKQGIDSMMDVLDIERTQLQAEDMLATSEIRAALDLIAIYKALGGGWQVIDEKAIKLKSP